MWDCYNGNNRLGMLVQCVIDSFIYMWLKGEGLFSHNKIIRSL